MNPDVLSALAKIRTAFSTPVASTRIQRDSTRISISRLRRTFVARRYPIGVCAGSRHRARIAARALRITGEGAEPPLAESPRRRQTVKAGTFTRIQSADQLP